MRRGQAESDPIKKSRIASFLKEYWGVRNGGDRKSVPQNGDVKSKESKGHNGTSILDIAEAIGKTERTTKRQRDEKGGHNVQVK